MSYEREITKACCSTCEFNFGDICAGHGIRIDNQKDPYGSNIDEMKKMFPDGCEDYDIDFNSFCDEEEHKKINWMERMKMPISYTNFEKRIMPGKEIIDYFDNFEELHERIGKHYNIVSNSRLKVENKYPELESPQKFVVFLKESFYGAPFCGIFKMIDDNEENLECVGFFAYEKE